jgi:hypothetical protein
VIAVTTDFRLSYLLHELLENSEFRFEHVTSLSTFSENDIVIQSMKDTRIDHPNLIVVNPKVISKSMLMAKIYEITTKESKGILVIGVDPGKDSGVAVIYNKQVIRTDVFNKLPLLIKFMQKEITQIKHKQLIIRIGDGGAIYNEPLTDLIFKTFHNLAKIEIIDETLTSTRSEGGKRTKHEEAAINIANRTKKNIEKQVKHRIRERSNTSLEI